MENDITESQSRNAAKVATFVAAIGLIGVASTKAVRYGKAKLAGRKTQTAPAHTAE